MKDHVILLPLSLPWRAPRESLQYWGILFASFQGELPLGEQIGVLATVIPISCTVERLSDILSQLRNLLEFYTWDILTSVHSYQIKCIHAALSESLS